MQEINNSFKREKSKEKKLRQQYNTVSSSISNNKNQIHNNLLFHISQIDQLKAQKKSEI